MKAFRCSRTGVLFPADYIEQWGIKYGIGLGCVPVSEALVNLYHIEPDFSKVSPDKAMYSVAACRAQVDFCEVTEEEWEKKKAVIAKEDQDYQIRSVIMRNRQLEHSTKIRSLNNQSKGVTE